jgi:uncharacterized protein (DUF4415 family)
MPVVKPARNPSGRTDWAALHARTEAEVEQMAVADADNPVTDESHWASATIGLPPVKTAVHASFDQDVVAFFKRGGKGYQARMNAVLRRYMEDQQSERSSD